MKWCLKVTSLVYFLWPTNQIYLTRKPDNMWKTSVLSVLHDCDTWKKETRKVCLLWMSPSLQKLTVWRKFQEEPHSSAELERPQCLGHQGRVCRWNTWGSSCTRWEWAPGTCRCNPGDFGWLLLCTWETKLPKAGKENQKGAVRTIIRAHTKQKIDCVPTQQSRKSHKTNGIRQNSK